ncbi:methylenetetrahydrofolate dehydrogenase-like protein [Leptomonas seymouri]|uniref:Methylenetetrahydrofolate dehydrogenase-like protein n=1 Tax=Leptomonas seymouri TaxID=5684 RepID=A0A0N1PAR1_LEPSE|nr:methylenetetrahydrofolate dehydrogenase-like protein [Leptomonas seymouri]|eukprot:KPI85725.1 methylenetetrahydrofolate dehydrogenase-like protein [Leptomonas seymouri]
MSLLSATWPRLRQAELLSSGALSTEMRRRIHAVTPHLSRAPCLAVVLVGSRTDSMRYVNQKRRAAAECGIEMRVMNLPDTIRQIELHKALAAVNGDVSVDGVVLQLPLPPHLLARPALFHIHPGKDVDGLHPLNAGNLFLQDQSPLIDVLARNTHVGADASPISAAPPAGMTASDRLAYSLTDEVMLLSTRNGGYNALRRRTHENKFFVPCTASAIRSILFSYLGRTDSQSHLLSAVHEDDLARPYSPPSLSTSNQTASRNADASSEQYEKLKAAPRRQRDLHAVIVNKSMVVGVPTAALLQRAGGFVVTCCSRSNSIEAVRCLAKQADVLITAYGQPKVFDASCVKEGAVIIDAAINELPQTSTTAKGRSDKAVAVTVPKKRTLCGDVDVASVSSVAAAVTITPGGVGPLTVSHLMMNVLKAYRLRHANHLYYNNIYTEFLKMYGTYDKVRNYAPCAALMARPSSTAMPADAVRHATQPALSTEKEKMCRSFIEEGHDSYEANSGMDDEDADNESYEV